MADPASPLDKLDLRHAVDVSSLTDDRIVEAARVRQRGIFNDRVLFSCAVEYIRLRHEAKALRESLKPKPRPPKGDDGV